MAAILEFLENSKTVQNQPEIDQKHWKVSILFKLSISMEKLEIKMHFKKFHVKIVKSGFWKSGCHGNDLIGTGIINTPLASPINFMKLLNFVAVAVVVFEDTNLWNYREHFVPPPPRLKNICEKLCFH